MNDDTGCCYYLTSQMNHELPDVHWALSGIIYSGYNTCIVQGILYYTCCIKEEGGKDKCTNKYLYFYYCWVEVSTVAMQGKHGWDL